MIDENIDKPAITFDRRVKHGSIEWDWEMKLILAGIAVIAYFWWMML